MSLGGEQVTFTAHLASNEKLLKLNHQYRTGTHGQSLSLSLLHEAVLSSKRVNATWTAIAVIGPTQK